MSVLDLPADGFNRRRPRFRLFEMEAGDLAWFLVSPELNAPIRALTPDEARAVWTLVAFAPWREGFWIAFATHRKATVYEDA